MMCYSTALFIQLERTPLIDETGVKMAAGGRICTISGVLLFNGALKRLSRRRRDARNPTKGQLRVPALLNGNYANR